MPHSKMDNVRDEAEDFYPDDLVDTGSQQFDDFDDLSQPRPYSMSKTAQSGLVRSGSGRPRSNTLAAPSSNPSSRESSPGGLTMSAGSSGGSSGGGGGGGGTAANGPRELERMKFGFGGGGGYGGSSLSQSDALDDYQVHIYAIVSECLCVCMCASCLYVYICLLFCIVNGYIIILW